MTTLKGNTHPLANAKTDQGRVRPDLPMTDLILVLSRSPEQQAAFDKFVESQYTPGSPNFHHWLTPEQVGAQFGASTIDIATISKWLTGHGFSIGEVTKDRQSIRFSGTAEQVESTFHTEIHNLEVKGVQHIGNMSDPQIPAALAPTVVGVKSLHNFFPRPLHRTGNVVTRDAATGKWLRPKNAPADKAENSKSRPPAPRPQFGISVPAGTDTIAYLVEDVVPYDFATIYNVLPLWNAGTPIDGTGQTIAIAGTSNIDLSDVTTFRSTFGLPAYTSANQPTAISGNKQPLTVCSDSTSLCTTDDLIENTLDVEWSGSIAKGANIVLVASYPASQSDDALYDSENYIVQNKTANIMNVSYGGCELFNGTAGNVEYYNLWQSASSEGIAVFVSSGDGGSAECDDGNSISAGNPYSAQYGLSVNGLASTPWNTAVGGTDFNWCALPTSASSPECTATPYWNSTNAANGSSAIGYVPEVPWNDTCANLLTVANLEYWATSTDAGNVGGVTDPESGCNFVYNNWQTVNTNSGGANLSYFVDTVGGGGGASGCVVNDGANVSSCSSSTTTTGSANGNIQLTKDGWQKPTWQANVAGIPNDGVRDLPDVSFFASDGFVSSSAYLICVSAIAACTYPTNSEPTSLEVGGTSVSSPAMAGVMALINQKAGEAQGSPNAELYTLASKQTYSNCTAEKATTGNSCLFNDIDSGTNAMPCDYGATEGTSTTAGIESPNCSVIHTGDVIGILPGYSATAGYDQSTGLGSLNVANVVNAWPASTATETATITVTPAETSVSASTALSVTVKVAATTASGTTPTGKVTLLGGGYSSGAQPLSSGAYTFTIPSNSLSAGSDVLNASYSGDTNYLEATSTATVTVTAPSSTGTAAATVTVSVSSASISASTALTVSGTVAASTSGGATPTGTVTVSGGGYTSSAATLSAGAYSISIPANSLTVGTDTLSAAYSGDATYAAATGTASVTVTAATSTGTFTLSPSTPSSISAGSQTSSSITVTATGGYAGTATLTCSLTTSPSSAVDLPTCSLSGSPVTLSSTTTTGTVTATISTTAPTTSQLTRPALQPRAKGWLGAGGGAVLAFLVFLGIPSRRRSWRSMLGALALMIALGCMSACGDFWQAPAGSTAGGTTSGTYTFTVSGTGDPAVSAAVSTTFNVTVN
ncbi:MAG: protease pro-enzyme activation domain-containing protein [Terracidiphilus sp.]